MAIASKNYILKAHTPELYDSLVIASQSLSFNNQVTYVNSNSLLLEVTVTSHFIALMNYEFYGKIVKEYSY